MADIRNLRNPFDKKRKEDAFFRTLKLQQKLAQEYNEAVQEKNESTVLGVTAVAPKRRSPEEEERDVSLQRQIAFENLKTVATPDMAEKIVNQLVAIGDASDLFYVNSNWEAIKQALQGRKNITDTFFRAFLKRFQEQRQATVEDGIETGIPPSTIELMESFDLMSTRQKEALGIMLGRFGEGILMAFMSIAPQLRTTGELTRFISERTGLDEGEIARSLNMNNPDQPLLRGTAPTLAPGTPLRGRTPGTPGTPGILPMTPATEPGLQVYTEEEVAKMTQDQISQINFSYQDAKTLDKIALRIEELNNPNRKKGATYEKIVGYMAKPGGKKRTQKSKAEMIQKYFNSLGTPATAPAEEGEEEEEEKASEPATRFLKGSPYSAYNPSVEDVFKYLARFVKADRDINATNFTRDDLQNILDFVVGTASTYEANWVDPKDRIEWMNIFDAYFEPAIEALYDEERKKPNSKLPANMKDYMKQIMTGVGMRGLPTSAPKFHRKGHTTLMLPREGNRRIVGRGISATTKPKYAEFGKFVIHIPSLNRGILNIKYRSMANVVNLPQQSISTDMIDFLQDMLETGKINRNLLQKLSKDDQRLFVKVAGLADIDAGEGYKSSHLKEERDEMDRFNLVKGIFLAGNNAPEVIKELQGFIRKFLNEGKIAKGEGLTLLQEISCLT